MNDFVEFDDGSNGFVLMNGREALDACVAAVRALDHDLNKAIEAVHLKERAYYDSRAKMSYIESIIVFATGAYDRFRGRPDAPHDTYLEEIERIWDRDGTSRLVLANIIKKCQATDAVTLTFDEYSRIMMYVIEKQHSQPC